VKRFFVVILFLFFLNLLGVAQEYNFRKVRWGMTSAEVIRAEKSGFLLDNRSRMFLYSVKLHKKSIYLIYHFNSKKLLEAASYEISLPIASPGDRRKKTAFLRKIRSHLIKKYGKPTTTSKTSGTKRIRCYIYTKGKLYVFQRVIMFGLDKVKKIMVSIMYSSISIKKRPF